MFDWQERLRTIPNSPGVYIMKGADDEVLYIGKANDLRRRVRQYFQESGDQRPFVRHLPTLLKQIEILLTHTEKEALLLEARMILEHQPRFNILLKDERRYLYLCLDYSHPYPRLQVVRRDTRKPKKNRKEKLFGPYLSGYAVRQTMQVIERWFRLRTCDDRMFSNRSRPCLEYQIKRCDAPCYFPIPSEKYQGYIDNVGLFLDGKHSELLSELEERMWSSAEAQQYEDAARYRDQKAAVERVLEERKGWKGQDDKDRDILGLFREGQLVEMQLLTIRQGQFSGGRSFTFDQQEFSDAEIFERFLSAYYLRDHVLLPQVIWLPCEIEGQSGLEEILSERSGRKVSILIPQRGRGRQFVDLARQNAEQSFFEKQKNEDATQKLLQNLQKRLSLSRYPQRIECIDNSHLQGTYPVSAIVVFEGGLPKRAAYRRYHIREATPGDDFGSMKEILSRRFKRGLEEDDLPDLLVLDGGRGQLHMALQVLEELGINEVPTISIAKQRSNDAEDEKSTDRIILPQQKNAIAVNPRYRELLLISQIRDQAHKTAVEFHQKTRLKAKFHSVLDDIPGVGPGRKKALLQTFGSIDKIREASVPELASVKGISRQLAEKILSFLDENVR